MANCGGLYSGSFHHDDEIKQRLRKLKRDLTALCFWHLFEMSRRYIKTLDAGLFDWSLLWRYLPWQARSASPTSHERDNSLWKEFADAVVAIGARYEPSGDVEAFVAEAMPIADRLYRQQERWEDEHLPAEVPAMRKAYAEVGWFGCFRYTAGDSRRGTRRDSPVDPHRAEMHIQNNVAPESPFADKRRLFGWMHEMVRDIEANHPDLQGIGTGSWLNNSEAFLQIYPPSYRRSLMRFTGDDKAGLGIWGQFITYKLTLNEPRAEILRREHRFECHHMQGTCDFAEFRDHVAQQLSAVS